MKCAQCGKSGFFLTVHNINGSCICETCLQLNRKEREGQKKDIKTDQSTDKIENIVLCPQCGYKIRGHIDQTSSTTGVFNEDDMSKNHNEGIIDKGILGWTLKEGIRWLLFLPAAIMAYIGIQLFVAIGNSIGMWFLPEVLINAFCQLINSVSGPYCFVLAGAKVAPRYSRVVAIVLVVISAIFHLGMAILAIYSTNYTVAYLTWGSISALLGIIASVIACVQIYNKEVKE